MACNGLMSGHKFKTVITAQKMKFSIKDFFSKCNNIRSSLRIWPNSLKKSLTENFNFYAAYMKGHFTDYDIQAKRFHRICHKFYVTSKTTAQTKEKNHGLPMCSKLSKVIANTEVKKIGSNRKPFKLSDSDTSV